MAERVEAVTIWMGRDLHHYFVPVPAARPGATKYVRGDVVADLLEALKEGRRAVGDHFAPNDCYATGPMTGGPIRDLVQCPACSFIAMHDEVLAKAEGRS